MPKVDFRDRLLECLGSDWPEPCPLNVRETAVVAKEGNTIRPISYDAEPGDASPALLLIPDGVSPRNRLRTLPYGISTTASGTWANANRPDSAETRCTLRGR